MDFEGVHEVVRDVPYITVRQARRLYDFVLEQQPDQSLELGFAYGATACYLAAALDEVGAGHLTAVDLERGRRWQEPSIEQLLDATGLRDRVTVVREHTSYTWFLKKKIEQQTEDNHCDPLYDFCYIDGPKNWTTDGFAFFLVDKLLNQGGTVLFDDLYWDYGSADVESVRLLEEYGYQISEMADDEMKSPHIDLVFRLLVMQQTGYSEFVIEDGSWAWARKTGQSSKSLSIRESLTLSTAARRLLRKTAGRLRDVAGGGPRRTPGAG